ncbi:Eco47II family restriction endonuclease [Salmonella enterica subsp. enterica serovar Edinburgh]|nr:Eco47II family restriction endonuclease [Salmonella enterica subsp. enterica serovar Edinburgh]EBH8946427.1 Eco47II family restriction endonuclease [Salmonella enterica subsp. enterica serovar 6,7:b:-]EJA5741191.1 Eco47II family restriction endonuclease [Salmonella enterica]EJA5755256.1 Eco47II family restriction endonuclease [Salmonella enterica]EJX4155963.1 Eco47II family restriction endonuclease [Salmonella enterica]
MSVFDRSSLKKILTPIVKSAYESEPSDEDLYRNTLDIFSASLDSAIRGITMDEWKSQEKQRQIQKTLQNKIGDLHQEILGSLQGVTSLGVGKIIDLEGNGFIAEIKNKHNTTKGNHKVSVYDDLNACLSKKDAGTIAYYVEILPKNGRAYNKPFVPSDNKLKATRPINERIRQVDGNTFYKIVTGEDGALRELYELLPELTAEILKDLYNEQRNPSDYIEVNEFNRIYKTK